MSICTLSYLHTYLGEEKEDEKRAGWKKGEREPFRPPRTLHRETGPSIVGSDLSAATVMFPMHRFRRVPPRLVRSKPFSPPSLGRRNLATLSDHPNFGEKLHGFTLERTKYIPELQLTAFHFNHDRTGAEYLHVARDDKNNVFSIGFKTNPPDHTGVPHILEHTTLCGSEKYSEQRLQ